MKKNQKVQCRNVGFRFIIFLLLFCGSNIDGITQNREIQFQTGTWKKQMAQAHKEKKLIFLDCYTPWCGFCKILSKYIFTNDGVADFYNTHFINVKMDMMVGMGPELAKKYEIRGYPTLLVLDDQGNLMDCRVGYLSDKELIDFGKRALDPEKNLAGMQKKYEVGNRELVFIKEYFRILAKAGKERMCSDIIKKDLTSLDDEHFFCREIWDIMAENAIPALPLMMNRLVDHRVYFDRMIGRELVDSVMDVAFMAKAKRFAAGASQKGYNAVACGEFKDYILSKELSFSSEYLSYLYVAERMNKKDFTGSVKILEEALKYHFLRKDVQNHLMNTVLRDIAECGDMNAIQAGIRLLDSLHTGVVCEDKLPLYKATRGILEKAIKG